MQKGLRFSFFIAFISSLVRMNGQPVTLSSAGTHARKVQFVPAASGVFTPNWEASFLIQDPRDSVRTLEVFSFEGALPDEQVPNLTYYKMLLPLPAGRQYREGYARAEEETEVFSSAFDRSASQITGGAGDFYPANSVMPGPVVCIKKQYYQEVRFYPIRVRKGGGGYRRAARITYALAETGRSTNLSPSQKTTASHSVLSSGQWWKIGVTHEGIFRLDAAFFSSLGINLSSLDPRQIRIYGTSAGVLPQENSAFRYDDLPETSIYVSGESDGVMDAGDYVLFYGAGPHRWRFDSTVVGTQVFPGFYHEYNPYSDTAYYFLTINQGTGKRLASVPQAATAGTSPSTFLDYAFYEEDLYNPILSGRSWLGENFDFTTDRTFSIPLPFLASSTNVKVTIRAGARSNYTSSFQVSENGTPYASLNPPATNTGIYGSYYYYADWGTFNIPSNAITDGSADIRMVYSKPDIASVGYLDYIEVNYMKSAQLPVQGMQWFSLSEGIGPGQTNGLNFTAPGSNYFFWDVSDPVNVTAREYSFAGNTLSANVESDIRRRLVIFNGGTESPASVQSVANQDLHGLGQADFFIISHPDFISEANRLADFHRSHDALDVAVVNLEQVFNEFSCGAQDPTAIRDFLKLFYDRAASAAEMPQYALFVGDGSYDYKGKVPGASRNYFVTYQSRRSMGPIESYTSDDFFGFLDNDEGFWGENAANEGGQDDILFSFLKDTLQQTHYLDLGIGRIPCNNASEVAAAVDKVIHYKTDVSGFGPWRNNILLIADHKDLDGSIHASQADSYSPMISSQDPCMNIDKVYLDNYQMINTPSGTRFPDAKTEIEQRMQKGCLILNYTGHGGELGWSNSKIYELPDVGALANGNRLPVFVTATCEFGRWDNHALQSGAELTYLNPNGGSIAMFTTVRVVYSHPNYELNKSFYNNVFDIDTAENRHLSLGEIFMRMKNDAWPQGIMNNRNFTLMGDPAVILNYPQYKAVVDSVNGRATQGGIPDTLRTLSLVTLKGHVEDESGARLNNFNGDINVTVFDKPGKFTTKRYPITFYWQKNRLFNGTSSVINGDFSCQFVVPIDISYDTGYGKISLYFQDGVHDGGGCDGELYVGGTGGITDNAGPDVRVFMNDEKWADGGLTGKDPTMLVRVFDDNGINTAGTGIGHELTCVFDENESEVIILNDYYSADKNTYKQGKIQYPFKDLSDGLHSVRVKVWDIANNSAQDQTTFVVADNAKLALGHLLNYPNPFTTFTRFYIEHNANGANLDLQLKIYTVSGKVVKSFDQVFYAEGNLFCDITWDGLDEYGDPIGRGVYVYQITLKNRDNGQHITAFEKLVVLR